jgi:hypothetical protein
MKEGAILEDFLGANNPIQVSSNGTFILDGGIISDNRSGNPLVLGGGGGVLVSDGSHFIMKSGTISGNQAYNDSNVYQPGGGISLIGGSSFEMTGGTISGNTGSLGAGVYLSGGSTIDKTGGTIYGDNNTTHTPGSTENTASTGNGHAVYDTYGPPRKQNNTLGPANPIKSSPAAGWE